METRTCHLNGEPLFCGKDVAEVLGYSNSRDAVRKHVEGEEKTTVAICDTGSNYKTNVVFINESGLYALILSSKLESARRFKHWVTLEGCPRRASLTLFCLLHIAKAIYTIALRCPLFRKSINKY